VGLIDGIKSALGFGAESAAQMEADPEDLFGMSTAHMTMYADLDFEAAGTAGLCFAGVDSTDFTNTVENVEGIVEAGDGGAIAETHEDDHGYQWVVLEDDGFEDLVVGVHAAADEFEQRGYDSRLLAAVFGFNRPDGTRAYWIYSFRRGSYYPFVPEGTSDRDNGTEFKLRSVLEGELDVEDDESYWYPLWPDSPGGHPWE
jgi:hypothetical protein